MSNLNTGTENTSTTHASGNMLLHKMRIEVVTGDGCGRLRLQWLLVLWGWWVQGLRLGENPLV